MQWVQVIANASVFKTWTKDCFYNWREVLFQILVIIYYISTFHLKMSFY